MNIYISNLGFSVTAEDLKKLFAPYGTITSASVIMDKFTNRSRGFGFVEMPDRQAAEAAMRALNGSMLDGRSVKMNEAALKDQRSTRTSFY